MNAPLRLKIAQYLTAGFPDKITALKEAGVVTDAGDERLAEQFLREATTAVMFVADNGERRLASDRTRGEYREEVEKIVDGVVADINGCKTLNHGFAKFQALSAAGRSPYATDPSFVPDTLVYGGHPSAYLGHVASRPTTAPVPWQEMAAACLAADVAAELERRPEYVALRRM